MVKSLLLCVLLGCPFAGCAPKSDQANLLESCLEQAHNRVEIPLVLVNKGGYWKEKIQSAYLDYQTEHKLDEELVKKWIDEISTHLLFVINNQDSSMFYPHPFSKKDISISITSKSSSSLHSVVVSEGKYDYYYLDEKGNEFLGRSVVH